MGYEARHAGLAAFAKATAASHRKSPSKPWRRRVPGIQVLASSKVDGRDEPGQGGKQIMPLQNWNPP